MWQVRIHRLSTNFPTLQCSAGFDCLLKIDVAEEAKAEREKRQVCLITAKVVTFSGGT